jgi:ABC-type amino acid transport substrate-binding protein
MKNLSQLLVTAIVAAIVSYGVVIVSKPAAPGDKTGDKSTPTAAHTLPAKFTCGWAVYPPFLMKDPNTGKFSGIFYDLTQKISDEIGIPVEWTVESSFGTAPTDLAYKKFDVFCSDLWADPKRGRSAAFSIPVFYAPILAYVRTDDTRFDGKTLSDLVQDPQLKAAVVDGEFSDIIRKSMFPVAQVLAEPQNTSVSQLAEDVVLKKADITFLERSVAADYMKTNPGKLKELPIGPLHLGETIWAFGKDENDLRELFNIAIRKLTSNGYVDQVLAKYKIPPGSLYRVAKPYEPTP